MKKALTLTVCLFLCFCVHINGNTFAQISSKDSDFGFIFSLGKYLKSSEKSAIVETKIKLGIMGEYYTNQLKDNTNPLKDNTNPLRENTNPLKDNTTEKYSIFLKGVRLFQQGELKVARDQFQAFNYGEPYFVSSLIEIQKINYINKNWDRFFGLAVYYRRVLLSNDKLSLSYFRQELLALEVLALIRHCRFQDSRKVIHWSLALAKRIKKNSLKIQKTKYFLSLDTLIGTQRQHKTKVKWKEQIDWWPLENLQLKQLDNPKNLRIRMDSQC